MRVVFVNHSDTRGGASVVTVRLMKALSDMGVDARMLVTHKATDDSRIALLRPELRRKAAFLAEAGEIFLGNGLHRDDIFKVSLADCGMNVHSHPWVKEADVVVLNWVNQGMMSLAEVARIQAPVVWTMHDMWSFTGACHHSGDCRAYTESCGYCKFFHEGKRAHDLSHRTFLRKQNLYGRKKIHFVAVSSWLASLAKDSTLLHDMPLTVIPNAFPVEEFSSEPKYDRTYYGLPEGKKLVIMGAARLDDPIKGFDMAIDTLNHLTDTEVAAVFFGDLRNPALLERLRIPYVHLGPVTSRQPIHDIYAHADVVLSSSLCETLPGTLIEGMASGCVPVSFLSGGQPDIVDHLTTGYLAPLGDTASLAEGIRMALTGRFDPVVIRATVAARFSASEIASRYLDLFKSL